MPINASERTQIAQAFLQCFGEDYGMCGRAAKFVKQFTNNSIDLLSAIQTAALTWQPFISSGLSIDAWNTELARVYNSTFVT